VQQEYINPMVIGIIGPQAAGKETMARFLEKKYGYKLIDMRLIFTHYEKLILKEAELDYESRKLLIEEESKEEIEEKVEELALEEHIVENK
jgi:dephospho-CoA kinase